jgi:hypothetical protein
LQQRSQPDLYVSSPSKGPILDNRLFVLQVGITNSMSVQKSQVNCGLNKGDKMMGVKEIAFMIKLHRTQLVMVWIMSVLISCYILVPVIKVGRFYKYMATDGDLMNFKQRQKEDHNQRGFYVEIGGKRFYYKGNYIKKYIDTSNYPYQRFGFVILLNGVLLTYTFRRAKQVN